MDHCGLGVVGFLFFSFFSLTSIHESARRNLGEYKRSVSQHDIKSIREIEIKGMSNEKDFSMAKQLMSAKNSPPESPTCL